MTAERRGYERKRKAPGVPPPGSASKASCFVTLGQDRPRHGPKERMPYHKAVVPHFKTQGDHVMTCPYHHKVNQANNPGAVNAYCEGHATGRLRIPSLFEEAHYCTTEWYADCPVFQTKLAQADREEDPCTSVN